MKTVLFACVQNAGRSQMAAALFNHLADPALGRAISAGTEPASRVHPEVADSMREIHIPVDGATPRRLTEEVARTADVLVTMGCGDSCPLVPGVKRLDWNLEDPKGRSVDEVRAIRDQIRGLVIRLIETEGLR